MWNKFKDAFFSFLAFYLFSCLVAFFIVAGILIFPLAVLVISVLAMKEMALWLWKPVKAYLEKISSAKHELPVKNLKESIVSVRSRVGDRVQRWAYYLHHDNFRFN